MKAQKVYTVVIENVIADSEEEAIQSVLHMEAVSTDDIRARYAFTRIVRDQEEPS